MGWVVGTLVVSVAHCSGNPSCLSTKCRWTTVR